MMNSDTNAEVPQEWKKKKGFFPTIVGASLLGVAVLSAGKIFTVNNNNEDASTNLVRWGIQPCFQDKYKGHSCYQKNVGGSCTQDGVYDNGKPLVGTCANYCGCVIATTDNLTVR